MVAPSISKLQLALLLAAASPRRRPGPDLSNRAFQLKYNGSGITSLRRTSDVADTDYIATGGALGGLLVRYRTTAHGDWKDIRQPILQGADASSIRYVIGTAQPGLAAKASGSAVQGVAGIRGLNDGLVPRPAGRRPWRRGRCGWRVRTSRCSHGRPRAAARIGAVHLSRRRDPRDALTCSGRSRRSRGVSSISRMDSGRTSPPRRPPTPKPRTPSRAWTSRR